MPFGGALPFLIDWGDSPHPAQSAPAGCQLTGFEIVHPDVAPLQQALNALGTDPEVTVGPSLQLSATIETPHGAVALS